VADGETLLHIAARKNLPQVITAVIGDKATAATGVAMDVETESEEEVKKQKKESDTNVQNKKRLATIINARNSDQQTALIRATHTHSFASYRNDKLLSALLEIQGIDVDAKDAKGNTGRLSLSLSLSLYQTCTLTC
jgi:ankyrin repeat protein